ncbi:Acid beta-fructofuranosidase-like protein [Drosera capensis]
MRDPDNVNSLSYPYTPLSGDEDDQNPSRGLPRATRIVLVILLGLLVSALIMTLQGGQNKAKMEGGDVPAYDRKSEDDVDVHLVRGRQPEVDQERGRGSSWHPVSRGKAQGVSEKTSGIRGHGVRGGRLVSEWNEDQLAWQRTAYHLQPKENWMNGPLMYKGWYHFFYQYNPNGPVWGDIVWGHAASMDLINWRHLPAALLDDAWYDTNGVWTGSATLHPDGNISMLYTGCANDTTQVQNLAYPADLSDPLLLQWIKYPGNPVLLPPPSISPQDFRDPTTAWQTSDRKWRMIIGSKVNQSTGISFLYETQDFKSFDLLDSMLHAVEGTGMWECVDFYPVSLTDVYGVDMSFRGDKVKHVLKASLDEEREDYYGIGTYDETRGVWLPDDSEMDVGKGLKYDYGKFYASKTFFDEVKKRRVLWGWVPESDSEDTDIRKGWASVQAIPRTIWLDQKTGTNLLNWPVEEVESLRMSHKDFLSITVQAGSIVPLDVGSATELDIIAEFEIDQEALEKLSASNEQYSCNRNHGASQRGALGPFGLLVLTAEDFSEKTPIYFYVTKGSSGNLKTFFCTDLSMSSTSEDVRKEIRGSTVPVLEGEKLSVRVLVDHSIIEAFAQGGRTCITSRVYPRKAINGDAKLFIFNNATNATITASINTWQMSPAGNMAFNPIEAMSSDRNPI